MIQRRKFVIGTTLIILAVGYLLYAGVRETSVYYFTIDEFLARQGEVGDAGVRVAGRVQSGSVDWVPRDAKLSFALGNFEGKGSLPVRYTGILPDMFGEGRDVIIEGRMEGEAFRAHTILTSCPSKYEPEVPES